MSLDRTLFSPENAEILAQLTIASEGGSAPLYLCRLSETERAVIAYLDGFDLESLVKTGVTYTKIIVNDEMMVGVNIELNGMGYPVLH